MSLLQLVVLEGKSVNGPLRFRALPARQDVAILPPDAYLREAPESDGRTDRKENSVAEQKTVIVLEVTHKKELPPELVQALTQRAYDFISAKSGDQAGIEAKTWYALTVKEMQ